MDPEKLSQWKDISTHIVVTALAAFCIVFGLIRLQDNPTALGVAVGAGLAMLGIAPVRTLDAKRRKNGGNGEEGE